VIDKTVRSASCLLLPSLAFMRIRLLISAICAGQLWRLASPISNSTSICAIRAFSFRLIPGQMLPRRHSCDARLRHQCCQIRHDARKRPVAHRRVAGWTCGAYGAPGAEMLAGLRPDPALCRLGGNPCMFAKATGSTTSRRPPRRRCAPSPSSKTGRARWRYFQ
jgi:hypothetical protein